MAWPSPNGKMNDAPQMRCEGQNVQCLELTKRECIRCQILIISKINFGTILLSCAHSPFVLNAA